MYYLANEFGMLLNFVKIAFSRLMNLLQNGSRLPIDSLFVISNGLAFLKLYNNVIKIIHAFFENFISLYTDIYFNLRWVIGPHAVE